MDNKQYRTLVTAMHFRTDENGMMVISSPPLIWKVGEKALKPGEVIEKGDIVLAKVSLKKKRRNRITCMPVLVINVREELITEDSVNYRDIVHICSKVTKKSL